jgi:hypothetical protein
MTQDEIAEAAAYFAARAAREINPRIIETAYPDGKDALHIYAALLTAHVAVSWHKPWSITAAKTLAVIGSPLLVPILAIMWTAWRLSQIVGSRSGKHRRSNS